MPFWLETRCGNPYVGGKWKRDVGGVEPAGMCVCVLLEDCVAVLKPASCAAAELLLREYICINNRTKFGL